MSLDVFVKLVMSIVRNCKQFGQSLHYHAFAAYEVSSKSENTEQKLIVHIYILLLIPRALIFAALKALR